jgi:hypothetical protein
MPEPATARTRLRQSKVSWNAWIMSRAARRKQDQPVSWRLVERQRRFFSKSLHQISNANSERVGDDLQRPKGHTLLSGLKSVQVDAIQTSQFRQLILRQTLLLADRLDSLANDALDVLQTLRLWAYAALKHPA